MQNQIRKSQVEQTDKIKPFRVTILITIADGNQTREGALETIRQMFMDEIGKCLTGETRCGVLINDIYDIQGDFVPHGLRHGEQNQKRSQ